jgi:hypothetical protein
MSNHRQTDKLDRVHKVGSFLADSAKDYIAARVLFLSQLPQQGAILASTAIEKSLKAILAFHGNESHGHLKKAHHNAIKNLDKKLFAKLDSDFLFLNQKVYSLRYTDDLPPDFNLVIATREFLAELDFTIYIIHDRFTFKKSGETKQTVFQRLFNDSRVYSQNHVLLDLAKDAYIYNEPQLVYEIRNDKSQGLVEITYTSATEPNDAGFLRPGYLPLNSNPVSYELSHLPLQDN